MSSNHYCSNLRRDKLQYDNFPGHPTFTQKRITGPIFCPPPQPYPIPKSMEPYFASELSPALVPTGKPAKSLVDLRQNTIGSWQSDLKAPPGFFLLVGANSGDLCHHSGDGVVSQQPRGMKQDNCNSNGACSDTTVRQDLWTAKGFPASLCPQRMGAQPITSSAVKCSILCGSNGGDNRSAVVPQTSLFVGNGACSWSVADAVAATESHSRNLSSATLNYSNTNLFVRRLPHSMNESQLRRLFEPYGVIVSSVIMRNIHTGESLGTAFVRYETHEQAKAAMTAVSSLRKSGFLRFLTVQWAKKEHDNTPAGEARYRLRKLFVRNIPQGVTCADLEKLFQRFGTLKGISMHRDTAAASSPNVLQEQRRIAFVSYGMEGVAERAANAVHNTCPFVSCEGVPLMVKLAEDSPVHSQRRVDRFVSLSLQQKNATDKCFSLLHDVASSTYNYGHITDGLRNSTKGMAHTFSGVDNTISSVLNDMDWRTPKSGYKKDMQGSAVGCEQLSASLYGGCCAANGFSIPTHLGHASNADFCNNSSKESPGWTDAKGPAKDTPPPLFFQQRELNAPTAGASFSHESGLNPSVASKSLSHNSSLPNGTTVCDSSHIYTFCNGNMCTSLPGTVSWADDPVSFTSTASSRSWCYCMSSSPAHRVGGVAQATPLEGAASCAAGLCGSYTSTVRVADPQLNAPAAAASVDWLQNGPTPFMSQLVPPLGVGAEADKGDSDLCNPQFHQKDATAHDLYSQFSQFIEKLHRSNGVDSESITTLLNNTEILPTCSSVVGVDNDGMGASMANSSQPFPAQQFAPLVVVAPNCTTLSIEKSAALLASHPSVAWEEARGTAHAASMHLSHGVKSRDDAVSAPAPASLKDSRTTGTMAFSSSQPYSTHHGAMKNKVLPEDKTDNGGSFLWSTNPNGLTCTQPILLEEEASCIVQPDINDSLWECVSNEMLQQQVVFFADTPSRLLEDEEFSFGEERLLKLMNDI